jgi:fructose-1,6-bisphosphatase/inositol monophosphatase family enzyme
MSVADLRAAERLALESHRQGRPIEATGTEDEAWVAWALGVALGICRQARVLHRPDAVTKIKEDGSPFTVFEREIEDSVRVALADFRPEAEFLGEESGGDFVEEGWTVAADPIDGTWAYLGHTETFSTVLNVFRDGRPYLGVVASPVVGELGYALEGGRSRLLRIDAFGEGDVATDLPFPDAQPGTLLVNAHPAREGATTGALLRAWERGELAMVRSPGGSPAWALLEAARGHFVYVNQWSRAPARPWDLAAGVLLVRGAGGDVVDLAGAPIDPLGASGPFVAGVDASAVDAVVRILSDGRGASGL